MQSQSIQFGDISAQLQFVGHIHSSPQRCPSQPLLQLGRFTTAFLLLMATSLVCDLDRIGGAVQAAIINDAMAEAGFQTYVCDNEANVTAQLDRTCDITLSRPQLTQAILLRSQSQPQRIKCLDCDIGTLRSAAGLRISMAANTVDLSGSHVEHVEAGAIAGTIRALLLSYNALTTLDDVKLFAATAQLRTLHADHNEIFYVDERAFDGVAELQELWLNHNRIVAVVARMFAHLPRLEKLRLHSNRLRTLDGDLLAANGKLRELTLYDNQLVRVHDDVWTLIQKIGSFDIANVQTQLDVNAADAAVRQAANSRRSGADWEREDELSCRIGSMNAYIPVHQLYNASCGNLTAVPSVQQLQARRYKYLNLRHNMIGELEQAAFATFPMSGQSALLTVDLTHNQIDPVHPNAFDTVPGLKELLLSHNFIRFLSPRIFAQLGNLLVLELHHNQIHTINAQQFWHTARLQRLTLHENRIKSVGEKAFDQLQRLECFEMSDNRVQNEVLIFLNADLVRLDRSNVAHLFIGDRVCQLEASRNRLRSLNLRHAFGLLHLNVSDNHIDAVDLEACHDLKTIDMSGNQLREIGFEQNAMLVEVVLRENFLDAVRFGSTALLQRLDLSGNKLTALQLPTATMYNLRELNVSRNQLGSLESLSLIYSLRLLDVSDNPIGLVTLATFQNMDSLESLVLRNTQLAQLQAGVFWGLQALRSLDLSSNHLTELDAHASLSGLVALEHLSVAANNLRRLQASALLHTLPKLQAIDVAGNRWQCDELSEFVRSMTAAYVQVPTEWDQVVEASVHGIRCAVNDAGDADWLDEAANGTTTAEAEQEEASTTESRATLLAAGSQRSVLMMCCICVYVLYFD